MSLCQQPQELHQVSHARMPHGPQRQRLHSQPEVPGGTEGVEVSVTHTWSTGGCASLVCNKGTQVPTSGPLVSSQERDRMNAIKLNPSSQIKGAASSWPNRSPAHLHRLFP